MNMTPKRKCQGKMAIQHSACKVIHPNLFEWCNYCLHT